MSTRAAFFVALTTVSLASSSAYAAMLDDEASTASSAGSWNVPQSMREGSRPHVLELGVGPYGRWFGAELSYLYHFSGGPEGPALGAVASGSVAPWGGGTFSIGGKFEWDFKMFPKQPLALYVGPFAAVSYQHSATVRSDVGGNARLLFNDRWSVFIQPVVVSMYIFAGGDYLGRSFWPTFHAALGGGVTF